MGLSASYRNYAQQYQRTQVETASPTQLVVMLYDGAIRFLYRAKERMLAKDIEGKHIHLIKAQKIVMELMSSLDRSRGGEIAVNLHRIYQYMLEQLVEANLYNKSSNIDTVLSMLKDLRESWAEVDKQQQKSREADAHATKLY